MTGQTATGGAVRGRPRTVLTGSRTGWAPIVVFAAAAAAGLLLAVGPAVRTDDHVEAPAGRGDRGSGREHERADLEQASEAWNYANIQLDQIDADLASNAKHLVAAKKSLVVSQRRIATRLRDLYINGQGDSTLEVILGSSSLDDIIARLDAIERVSSQDAQILRTVKQYRKEVETRRTRCSRIARIRRGSSPEQADRKQYIESQIAEQKQMLDSVKDEIAQMRAEEARRQAALAAQARARAQAAASGPAGAAGRRRPDRERSDLRHAVVRPEPPGASLRQVVGIALQYLGIPYVWGGSSPSTGFDCSGFVAYVFAQVGVSLPHHAASQYGYGTPVSYDQLAARRPRLLQRARTRGDLHRRRPVRPRAAHRRRRADREPRRPRLVRRRPPALARAVFDRIAADLRLGVERVDLVREVLLDGSPPELQRRRDLALLHREVAWKDGEALDLLEAGALAVRIVDRALQELVDALVARERGDVALRRRARPPSGRSRPGRA